ncbi:MAG: GTPase HflX, partial [Candidatus Cloacimonetes bacterium]|nr:GTPase HflX [Candidatus Cloacimonadota bacterium]
CLDNNDYLAKEKSLDVLELLAKTAGLETVGRFIQRRKSIDKTYYVGHGFILDLKIKMDELGADFIIFDNELMPSQGRNITKLIEVSPFDRTEIILKIFHEHARTGEARLQVKLAELKYEMPRLKNKWSHFENERVAATRGSSGSGGASRGMGETQTEIDKRKIKDEINKIERILKKNLIQLETKGKLRKEKFKLVCLVGYTNAGKSTLFNTLTNSSVYVEDKLFATLDSTSKALNLGKGKDVILSDTVGFVADLPHHLVASFRATLKEVVDADLLLHVVDFSDDEFEKHINDVETVLKQIEAENVKQLIVFNKIDKLQNNDHSTDFVKTRYPKAVWISACEGINIDELLKKVDESLNFAKKHSFLIPHTEQKTVNLLFKLGKIIEKDFLDEGVKISALVNNQDMPYFQKFIINDAERGEE